MVCLKGQRLHEKYIIFFKKNNTHADSVLKLLVHGVV